MLKQRKMNTAITIRINIFTALDNKLIGFARHSKVDARNGPLKIHKALNEKIMEVKKP
jgi:hypothetical protein